MRASQHVAGRDAGGFRICREAARHAALTQQMQQRIRRPVRVVRNVGGAAPAETVGRMKARNLQLAFEPERTHDPVGDVQKFVVSAKLAQRVGMGQQRRFALHGIGGVQCLQLAD